MYPYDLLEHCGTIRHYTDKMLFDKFVPDLKIQNAVVRNFEIIGKGAKRLRENAKSKYSGTEWAKLIGFHNILIHDYFGAKLENGRNAVQDKIPILEKQTQKFLNELSNY